MFSKTWIPAALTAVFAAACAAGAGDAATAGALNPGTGRVEAALVSSGSNGPMQLQTTGPGPKVKAREVIVTIAKVTAHVAGGGWVNVASNKVTVDVLKLGQYAKPLGFADLPKGKLTQIRLYVDESGPQYVTTEAGERVDLKVPSGLQSGIKVKGVVDISDCALNSFALDLDGKKSVWVHPTGQGDEWILRPVIRMGRIEASGLPCAATPPPGGGTGGGAGTIGGTGGGAGTIGGTGGGAGTIGGTGGGSGTGGGTGGIEEGPGNGGPGGPSGAGATCNSSLLCLSGSCVNGLCAKGGPDAPCGVSADCVSNQCSSAGTCSVGPSAGGTGTACTSGAQCLSGGCTNQICEPGSQGRPCVAATDCGSGLTCLSGVCDPGLN